MNPRIDFIAPGAIIVNKYSYPYFWEISMRISERGQVTIPQEFRERYGLLANTEVRFIPNENGLRLVADPASRAAKIDSLYGRKQFGRSTDELMSLLRE